MTVKKIKTITNNATKKQPAKADLSSPVVMTQSHRYEIHEIPAESKGTFKRFLLIVFLLVLNAAVWSFLCYQIRVLREDAEYTKRSAQQYERARRLEKMREAEAIAVDTVAFVDGKPITMTQVRETAEEMPQLSELPFEKIYPNLLEMLINSRVVMQGAQKAGVLDRPEIRTQLRLAKEQIVGQTYLDELLAAHVSEAELKAVYEQELKNFKREEEIHARHILVKTEKEAKDIILQLKAGADFAELADKKSLDENTGDGGDLGYFTKAMMIPEFGNAVFDMKKGQLSAPIKTVFGWHVVLVEDKRLANPPAFDEVREDILRAVMETKLPQVLEEERVKMNVRVLRPTLEEESETESELIPESETDEEEEPDGE